MSAAREARHHWIRARRLLLGPASSAAGLSLAALVLRLTFGLAMAWTHGRGTLNGFPEHAAEFPDPLGLGSELSMGLMVLAEFFCAWLVVVGLLTRLALIPLVFGLSVAFFVFHAADPFARKELAYLYLSVFTALLVAGPGRFSADFFLLGKVGGSDAGGGPEHRWSKV